VLRIVVVELLQRVAGLLIPDIFTSLLVSSPRVKESMKKMLHGLLHL